MSSLPAPPAQYAGQSDYVALVASGPNAAKPLRTLRGGQDWWLKDPEGDVCRIGATKETKCR